MAVHQVAPVSDVHREGLAVREGERMLGGGDKGASGALVRADAADALRKAIETGYPRSRPDFADKFAMHVCKVVDGIKVLEGLL